MSTDTDTTNVSKDLLQEVLNEAHDGHRYITDTDQYNKIEHWTINLVGDCEDFALWVRRELKKKGIAADLVMCLTEDGGGHLVCSVGGYILDNRYMWVMNREDLNYTWLKLGKPDGTWYNIES